jgi:hypothetical protein
MRNLAPARNKRRIPALQSFAVVRKRMQRLRRRLRVQMMRLAPPLQRRALADRIDTLAVMLGTALAVSPAK